MWHRIFAAMSDDPSFEYLIIDSTIIRAHQHASGAKKRGLKIRLWPLPRRAEHQDPSGGARPGRAGGIALTSGQRGDCPQAYGLIANSTRWWAWIPRHRGQGFHGMMGTDSRDRGHPVKGCLGWIADSLSRLREPRSERGVPDAYREIVDAPDPRRTASEIRGWAERPDPCGRGWHQQGGGRRLCLSGSAAGLSWPLPAELDDTALERRLQARLG